MRLQWKSIDCQGQRVYWRAQLPDGSILTVKQTPEGYGWAWRGPDNATDGTLALHAAGHVVTTEKDAKRAARQYIEQFTRKGMTYDD